MYGTLTLTDNNLNATAPNYATQTIALSGDAPVATVSATMLAFGAQQALTASAPQQVTLTNAGSAALTITNIAVSGDECLVVFISESLRDRAWRRGPIARSRGTLPRWRPGRWRRH